MASLLLDTHAFLRWRANDGRIGDTLRQAIQSAPTVFVSMASAWEVAIKVGLGRMQFDDDFAHCASNSGFVVLPIRFAHLNRIRTLPHHHRDPFDRMLIAQAQEERLTLATNDACFAAYGIDILPTAT